MNSFTAWVGGKKLLRKNIIGMFPNGNEIGRYIEVFGGAGWVLFGKDPDKHLEVYNDIDSNLVNLYRCIKYHCEELQKELDWMLNSREQFFDSIHQLDTSGFTDIQRAARYLFIIKISFGADRRSFGTNKKNLSNTIEYLSQIKERLKNVVIENKSFENLIKVYDRENALFYLDPPYLGAEAFYDHVFSMNDHIQLNTVLKSIKGKFLLSYNDNSSIKDLYKDFNIVGIERNNNLTTKVRTSGYKEVIIKNY